MPIHTDDTLFGPEYGTDHSRERVSRAAYADHCREMREAAAAWATLVRLGWIEPDAVEPWVLTP